MKQTLILFVLFAISTYAKAQVHVKDGKGFYEIIDSSVHGTKTELQAKAKLWMVNAFKDAKEVIQLDDKEAGEVVGKGNFQLGGMGYGRCAFTIKISARDNKYRCQVYDFIVYSPNGLASQNIEYYIEHPKGLGSKKTLTKTDDGVKALLESLQAAMKKQADNF